MNHLLKSGFKSAVSSSLKRSSASFNPTTTVARRLYSTSSGGNDNRKLKAIYDQSILENYDQKAKQQQQQTQLQTKKASTDFIPTDKQHPKLKEFIESLPTSSETSSTPTSYKSINYSKPEITTLPNGIKVISIQRPESACAIGLYIKGGSNYETEGNRGVFHLLEKMVFKSTKNETSSEIVRKYENISLNAVSSSSKGVMQISIEVLRKDVEYVLQSFADQITCPLFLEEDIEEQKQNCAMSYDMMITSPDNLLPEILLNVAYGDEGYGQSLIVHPEELEKITAETLRHTVETQYVGKNIVISATGIDHPTLVSYVSKYFSSIPYTSQVVQDQQQQQHQQQSSTMLNDPSNSHLAGYKGGSRFFDLAPGMEQSYYFAFPAPGLKSMAHSNDVFIAFVLQTLLGGGSDFSSGGPGKGMQSRLNLHVVYALTQVRHCAAFYNLFPETSLFGVSVTTNEGYLNEAVNMILRQLLSLKRLMTPVELERAKRQQKSLILMNLELRGVMADDMARQLLTAGVWRSPEEICRGIDSVTIQDVLNFVDRLTKNTPSIVALMGEKDKAPNVKDFKNIIGTGKLYF